MTGPVPVDGEFTPKLVSALREGYGPARFRADALAGLTVAIVALPLSMAIAIASGASPERGLYTAIVGGFLISLLGGSRHQIGGPAGAFIVLVAGTIEAHGFDGLLLATLMAGAMMALIGWLRLGGLIRLMPGPVIVGFTAGIAAIIFASQIRDLLGLSLTGKEPAALLPKLGALWAAATSINPAALALAVACIAIIAGLRRWRPAFPGLLVAVTFATILVATAGLPVDTIGTRFGGLPAGLPAPTLPDMSAERLVRLLPSALAIALLGGIESLLSAVVADGMAGRRHRPNIELVAQGVANMATALFGGICATGTIARTATNIRAGAQTPVAGMLHAAFLLVFLLLASGVAAFIPLAALAAVLAVVAWNMVDRHDIAVAFRERPADALVMGVTFALTLVRDLTEGIAAGILLSLLLAGLRRLRA
jgi:SulP family sulfate permease